MAKEKKENKKLPKANRKNKKDSDDAPTNSRRTLWIALAVLAALAVLLWYLNRQGYLRRWFPAATRGSRFQQPQYYDASPSAPPYPGGTEGF